MRWKIIIVNAGIVIVVGLLTYVLLATSLKDVLANQAERKRDRKAFDRAGAEEEQDAGRNNGRNVGIHDGDPRMAKSLLHCCG